MQNSHDDFFGGDASRKLSSIMVPVSGTLLSGIRGVLSRFHDCGIRYRQVERFSTFIGCFVLLQ